MQLHVNSGGAVTCLYGESIDLSLLGALAIRRASHVEPDDKGCWWANLSPVRGPLLGPYKQRSDALDAERRWLEDNFFGGRRCGTNQQHDGQPDPNDP